MSAKYYVVEDGRVVSANRTNAKWTAFRTPLRNCATPLSRKHALAFSHMRAMSKVITEQEFKNYKLKGEN